MSLNRINKKDNIQIDFQMTVNLIKHVIKIQKKNNFQES